jgi:mRNA interferase MazF
MSSGLRRGEIYRVRQPQHGNPKKSRCFAVVSRQDLLDSKANRVLCAPINTSGVGLSTEVQVGVDEGLKHDSVINCDQITRLEKSNGKGFFGTFLLQAAIAGSIPELGDETPRTF